MNMFKYIKTQIQRIQDTLDTSKEYDQCIILSNKFYYDFDRQWAKLRKPADEEWNDEWQKKWDEITALAKVEIGLQEALDKLGEKESKAMRMRWTLTIIGGILLIPVVIFFVTVVIPHVVIGIWAVLFLIGLLVGTGL